MLSAACVVAAGFAGLDGNLPMALVFLMFAAVLKD